ncbi:MAG: aminopeptidase P N-terminal domain-containing protein, partial [Chitinophagales bacterium]
MKYEAINNKLFRENRARFTAKMKPNSIAIFQSNDEMPRSADSHHIFRQNPDLFYLTGIDQEQTILVLFPDCVREEMREILFIRKTNSKLITWEGHKYTIEEAKETSAIETIYWGTEFWSHLPGLMFLAENCYLNLNEHGRKPYAVLDREMRFAHELRQKYPLHHYHRSAPIMHQLRAIKSPLEVALIQHACNITEKAFRRILQFVKPGVHEYEIEAEILHEYLINRATGPAYPSIIASGGDSCILHYVDNNKQCKDGDVLLMDFGAEYANYAADLSRTIPVSGQFTDRQRAVYNAVLRVMKQAKTYLVPGITLEEYHKEVGKMMQSELVGLKLID